MNPDKLAWYRQRAEERGEAAQSILSWSTDQRSTDDADLLYAVAREAGHYGNLVLEPYLEQVSGLCRCGHFVDCHGATGNCFICRCYDFEER